MSKKNLPTAAEINLEMRTNTLKMLRDPKTNSAAYAALMKRYAELEKAALASGIGQLSRAEIQSELTECANRLGRKVLE